MYIQHSRYSDTTQNGQTGNMSVVKNHTLNIEREVDRHVNGIRALIEKLTPTERQKYYNGLLAFILNEQVEMTEPKPSKKKNNSGSDYSKLTTTELNMLEEMSAKMQELYCLMGDTE